MALSEPMRVIELFAGQRLSPPAPAIVEPDKVTSYPAGVTRDGESYLNPSVTVSAERLPNHLHSIANQAIGFTLTLLPGVEPPI